MRSISAGILCSLARNPRSAMHDLIVFTAHGLTRIPETKHNEATRSKVRTFLSGTGRLSAAIIGPFCVRNYLEGSRRGTRYRASHGLRYVSHQDRLCFQFTEFTSVCAILAVQDYTVQEHMLDKIDDVVRSRRVCSS